MKKIILVMLGILTFANTATAEEKYTCEAWGYTTAMKKTDNDIDTDHIGPFTLTIQSDNKVIMKDRDGAEFALVRVQNNEEYAQIVGMYDNTIEAYSIYKPTNEVFYIQNRITPSMFKTIAEAQNIELNNGWQKMMRGTCK